MDRTLLALLTGSSASHLCQISTVKGKSSRACFHLNARIMSVPKPLFTLQSKEGKKMLHSNEINLREGNW